MGFIFRNSKHRVSVVFIARVIHQWQYYIPSLLLLATDDENYKPHRSSAFIIKPEAVAFSTRKNSSLEAAITR